MASVVGYIGSSKLNKDAIEKCIKKEFDDFLGEFYIESELSEYGQRQNVRIICKDGREFVVKLRLWGISENWDYSTLESIVNFLNEKKAETISYMDRMVQNMDRMVQKIYGNK